MSGLQTSKFDLKLDEAKGNIPEKLHRSFQIIHDDLEISRRAAEEIFADKARPEHAFEILRLARMYSGILTNDDFDSVFDTEAKETLMNIELNEDTTCGE